MKCKNELEYITQVVNDHLATLAPSSKVVVAREAQNCIQNIAAALNPPPDTGALTAVGSAPTTSPSALAPPPASLSTDDATF